MESATYLLGGRVEDTLQRYLQCRERGILTRNQAHGSPGSLLDLYAQADIPETEMFNQDRNKLVSKFASSAAHVTGMLVALAGLTLIFGASLASGPHMAAGLAALCASVVLQSLSLVLIKRHAGPLPSLSVTAGALAIATPLFFLTWLVFDRHAPAQLPTRALASIVYLGVIGSVLGFTLFFYVLKHVSAHGSALITLITPVLALLLGAAINHEHVGPRIWAGTALVLGGLALHLWGGMLGRLALAYNRDRSVAPDDMND